MCVVPVFGNRKKILPVNYRPTSPTSVSDKIMEKFALEIVEKYLRDYSVIGHSQDEFTRGKYSLSSLISF